MLRPLAYAAGTVAVLAIFFSAFFLDPQIPASQEYLVTVLPDTRPIREEAAMVRRDRGWAPYWLKVDGSPWVFEEGMEPVRVTREWRGWVFVVTGELAWNASGEVVVVEGWVPKSQTVPLKLPSSAAAGDPGSPEGA